MPEASVAFTVCPVGLMFSCWINFFGFVAKLERLFYAVAAPKWLIHSVCPES